MARGKRFSAEQIVTKLRQIEVQLAQGNSLALACKQTGISEQSRDRHLQGPRQSYPPPFGAGLSATRSRYPGGDRKPPTHANHLAIVSLNPVQMPGQVKSVLNIPQSRSVLSERI